MAVCTYTYQDSHAPCGHPATGDSGLCLWHNPVVSKSDPYVRDLLTQADAAGQADLSEFHLVGLQWPGASLPLRKLTRVDFRDAHLDGADLSGCELSHAVLRRTSLKRADLRGARLVGADLSGTNLTDADLRDADLSGAQLAGTVLNGCDLRGANLAGAKVVDFSWNRRTRFAGVKGLDADRTISSGDEDPTQAFPAPLALCGVITGDISALEDPDPELCRTHLYAPAVQSVIMPAVTAIPVPELRSAPSRNWRWATAASIVLAVGGVGFGVWGWSQPASTHATVAIQPTENLKQELANLQRQHEADLAQIQTIQEQLRGTAGQGSSLKQEVALRQAEADALRSALRASESDLLRMQGVDDRATLLSQKVDELTSLNAELARETGRQGQVGRILALGVGRLKTENQVLAADRDQQQIDRRHLADIESEVARLRESVAAFTSERTDLLARNAKLSGDLFVASRDIERYLNRVNASHLQDYLTDDQSRIPLLTVARGKPIALSGDYLVTLRVDQGQQPGTVLTHVVVQRPPSATNPDVTVVLYDENQQPLRRLAYSFPHVDANKPFVSSTTEVACERFPAFARVMIAPGLDGLSAKR
jgi:uncharacterized protein YjbI with pentapeptide repeats/cell division septum initiation protein DivIVA